MSDIADQMSKLPNIDSLVLVFPLGDRGPIAGYVRGYLHGKEDKVALSVQFGASSLALVEPEAVIDLDEIMKTRLPINYVCEMGHA